MSKPKNDTEWMLRNLRHAEAILGALDQAAGETIWEIGHWMEKRFQELLDLRDRTLREWNEEASSGPRDPKRAIYRCDGASTPYHLHPLDDVDEKNPCEVYTTNWQAGDSLCDACKRAKEAANAAP